MSKPNLRLHSPKFDATTRLVTFKLDNTTIFDPPGEKTWVKFCEYVEPDSGNLPFWSSIDLNENNVIKNHKNIPHQYYADDSPDNIGDHTVWLFAWNMAGRGAGPLDPNDIFWDKFEITIT